MKVSSLSDDGNYCIIGGGYKNFFYIIALETQKQIKLNTEKLTYAFAPCFINGESNLIAVGGNTGEGVEIWNVANQEMVHHIQKSDQVIVTSMYSANGILAVGFASHGGDNPHLQLYDVSSWTAIYRHKFELRPWYLFLTQDNKYLAAGLCPLCSLTLLIRVIHSLYVHMYAIRWMDRRNVCGVED